MFSLVHGDEKLWEPWERLSATSPPSSCHLYCLCTITLICTMSNALITLVYLVLHKCKQSLNLSVSPTLWSGLWQLSLTWSRSLHLVKATVQGLVSPGMRFSSSKQLDKTYCLYCKRKTLWKVEHIRKTQSKQAESTNTSPRTRAVLKPEIFESSDTYLFPATGF